MKIPRRNIQPNPFVRYNVKQLTSRMCTICLYRDCDMVIWTRFWGNRRINFSKGMPRIVEVYVARRKGSLIFDLFIAYAVRNRLGRRDHVPKKLDQSRLATCFQPPLIRDFLRNLSYMSELWAFIPIVWQSSLKTFVIFGPVTSVVPWKHLLPHENEHMRPLQIYVHKNEEGHP